MLKFVSLFSGAGGMDCGFIRHGWHPMLLSDNWLPAINTLKHNHSNVDILFKDITKTQESDFSQYVGCDILAGGPPCQAFSRLNQNQLFDENGETEINLNDPRRSLFMDFLKVAKYLRPKVIVMENVADLKTRKLGGNLSNKNDLIINIITQEFNNIGYDVVWEVLNALHYDVPQMRKRIFFIAIDKNLNIAPSMPKAVQLRTSVLDEFNKILPHHPNQDLKNHSSAWIDKIKHIPPGGYYNDLPIEYKVLKEVNPSIPQQKPKDKYHYENGKVYKIMPRMGTYLRRIKEDLSHTVTRNPLIHPSLDREITVREKASIQTFDPEYIFCGSITEQHLLVGNAVPCNLASEIAKHIEVLLNVNSN